MRDKFDPEEMYTMVCVNDKPYLYCDLRIDKDSISEGLYAYECADFNGTGRICRINKDILVDFYCTIIGKEPLPTDANGNYWPKLDREYDYERNKYLDSIIDLDDYDILMEKYDEDVYPEDDEFYFMGSEVTMQRYLEEYEDIKDSLPEKSPSEVEMDK